MSAAARQVLADCYRAAVQAVHGETLLRARSRLRDGAWELTQSMGVLRWPLPDPAGPGRVRIFGAGKAVASMARGMEAVLGERISDGLVVGKRGHLEPLGRVQGVEGGHPLPDAASEAAAARLLATIGDCRREDCCIFLLSGGASALLAAPAAGLTLADEQATTRLLVASRAAIDEINVVRRHLSAIKGGQLARRFSPAPVLTLAISDVLGNDPAAIGSGPTVADPSSYADALGVLARHGLLERVPRAVRRHLELGSAGERPETPKPGDALFHGSRHVVIASLDMAIAAALNAARAAGCDVLLHDRAMRGDTHQRAAEFAAVLRALTQRGRPARPVVVVAGGETTLELRGAGSGGRNQEFAVVAARELHGVEGVTLLAAGTDGSDGPTDAAGGWADGDTIGRARRRGVEVAPTLADNDSARLLRASDDLFVTGPTGTNVCDLVLGYVA